MEPRLNKTEVWVAEHSIRIGIAIAVLMLVGAFFVVKTLEETGKTSKTVKRIEPQVTKINRALCDQRSLETAGRAERCAERIRIGLLNCRRHPTCRAALLGALSPPPDRDATSRGIPATGGGGANQQPSNHGHQHVSPGSSPGPHEQGHSQGHESAPESPQPAPEAESPGHSGGQNGDQNGGGGHSSGLGVEVCAITCIGAEVGLPKPKGP